MQALRETTVWKSDLKFPNHTYLLDGTNLLAYIKQGTKEVIWFSKPIRNFDKRRRTFVKADMKLFKGKGAPKVESSLVEVKGSKGDTYYVDPERMTCTCSGFQFRGKCKHLEQVLNK